MKPIAKTPLKTISAALAACCLLAAGSFVRADDAETQNEFNKQYRENFDRAFGDHYTGRSPYLKGRPEMPRPKPIQIAKPAPERPVEKMTCSAITSGPVHMTKTMPAEAQLGQEFMYELNPTAVGCVGNVVVEDHIPPGASYVRSEPPAEVNGEHLVWKIHEMDPGQSRPIKVWLKAEKEGTLASCATVHADPRVCAQTFVGKPLLAIDKSGPETAQLGQDVTYNIVVSNKGTSIARNVVVTDQVPNGMSHSSGQKEVTLPVGDLAPNQSKTLTITLKANERGKFCNNAIANSSNAGKVNDDACTVVVKPGLKIVKTGDKEQFLLRNAKYHIVVSNTGDTTLTGVVVTDTAPAQTSIVSASGASVSGNTATWNVGSLASGASKEFDVVLTSKTPGTWCNGASVTCNEKLRESSEACTLWKGISALLLEKGDNPDPIQVGETTTYYVRVTNQGTADDTNVKVVVEFPGELTPVSADNGGQVNGQRVTFPAYPRLAPKAVFEYHVTAKGAKPGDARVKFIRTSDDIPNPTTAEESTRVY